MAEADINSGFHTQEEVVMDTEIGKEESIISSEFEEKKDNVTTLPHLQNSNGFFRATLELDLLGRMTKGIFPDIVPDEKTLESLTKNFVKEQGAVPVMVTLH